MFKLLIFFHWVRYDPMVSDRPDVPYLTRFQNIRSDLGRAGLLMNTLPNPDPVKYRQDLFHVISSRHETDFGRHRFHAGIGKPSIFDGVHRILDLLTCFGGDLMHQPLINMAALLLDLWCAQPSAHDYDRSSDWPWAVLVGDVWKRHGKAVSGTAIHFPTSFGRVPRNPQEKISSGYKAWEFLYYIYGQGPGVFFGVLLEPYYSHFCKLVRAIRLVYQRTISRQQLVDAHVGLQAAKGGSEVSLGSVDRGGSCWW